MEVCLKVNTVYYIVPSLYKREQPGTYYLTVYSENDFELSGASKSFNPEQRTIEIGKGDNNKVLTAAQYYAKKESLRDKMVSESKRLNLSIEHISAVFKVFHSLIRHIS